MCGVLAAAGGICFWVARELPREIITVTPVVETMSPDGNWKVVVDETFYEPGWGGGQLVDSVHLIPMRHPHKVVDMLTVEPIAEEHPRLVWTANDVLQITVANLSDILLNRREYGGIRIDLRFDPDDPAARAAWLRKHREVSSPHPDR